VVAGRLRFERYLLITNIQLITYAVIHYKVLATEHEVGWIEVVRHSTTTASIQKQASGVSAIFNEKTLARWLREHNPSELEYKAAVDTFVRTCAASCVATYLNRH
jgi:phosphatidylinositol kinase/protein kinase (PI-3  family)